MKHDVTDYQTGGTMPYQVTTTIENPNPIKFRLFDDRIPVSRPDIYPSRTVGQILVRLKDGRSWSGSGSLLSDYTVLTAGHVVKDSSNNFYDFDFIRFIPARNHQSEPYGRFDWMEIRAIHSGARDWALISLTQPAGFSTGFLGARAKLPLDRWTREGDRFSHIGFPGDHQDEMWIDEDGACTGIHESRQLLTDIDAAHGQSGGPLTVEWFSSSPRVAACLVWGPNPVEDPNYFMPGYETSRDDTWLQWLCDRYGRLHPDDRFQGCINSLEAREATDTYSSLPNYGVDSYTADDSGPVIRRFSPRRNQHVLSAYNVVAKRMK